ncbi:MAG: PIN domain-containing protein [Candidatus Korarchaeota archaeon]|nr:PIN domain-containing protein [Candidatus Korarchaeota archaeon]
MPLIELDILLAFINRSDKHHEVASRVIEASISDESYYLSSVALIEMSLIYRSRSMELELEEDLRLLLSLFDGRTTHLTPLEAMRAVWIRRKYGLSFFDSLNAASAMSLDSTIVSFDEAYDDVEGLRRIDPEDLRAK